MGGDTMLTEYGPVSAHFDFALLGELCEDKCGIQTGPFGSQLHQRDYVSYGTPIITVEHLGENRIRHENLPRVTDDDRYRLSRYILHTGDIVLSRVGSVDRRSLVRPEEEGWLFSGRCLRVRARGDVIDPDYLSWFFGHPSFKEYIRRIAVGATMPSLNTKILRNVPIYFPPLPEQRAIAHILGSLDDKIELNRRMNETLEAMARAIFKSWFVDFDPVRAKAEGRDTGLPGEIADLFPDSFEELELGAVPEGWKVGCIGDIGKQLRQGVKPEELKPDEAYIALEHMPRKSISLSDWTTSEGITSGKFRFKKNNILFGKLRPYFHKVGVPAIDGVCSTDIIVATPSQGHWFGLLLGHLSSDEFIAYTNAASTGTKMPRTNWKDMSCYRVTIPPTSIVEGFNYYSRAFIDQIHANIFESHTLASIRNSLLPKLISGEMRVPDAEKFVEETEV